MIPDDLPGGSDAPAVPPRDRRRTDDPATTAAIEATAFDPADVAAKRVSYRMLVRAGVDPGIADRLRRTHSLVWSFEWVVGDSDLAQRAARLRGLAPAERAWIAASAPIGPVAPDEVAACPRCGETLETYTIDDRTAVHCGGCGYAGVAADHRSPPPTSESWDEALGRFDGDRREAHRSSSVT